MVQSSGSTFEKFTLQNDDRPVLGRTMFLQLLNVDAYSFGKNTEAMQLQNWFALIGIDSIMTWGETSSFSLKHEIDT